MFNKKSTETLVIGAGPIGMMAALVLSQNDRDVIIIDKAERIGTRNNAVLLHPSTLQLLHRVGVIDQVLNSAYAIDQFAIYDDSRLKTTLQLGLLDSSFPFAASIPQSILESILERKLEREGIPILWNHKATNCRDTQSGVEVEAQHPSEPTFGYTFSRLERMIDRSVIINARLAIATDGVNSLIRKRLKIRRFQGASPGQFVIFDFKSDVDFENTMRFRLQDGLITAQTPIGHGLARLTFEFMGLDLPEEYRIKTRTPLQEYFEPSEMLEDEHLLQLIAQRVPCDTGHIERVLWRKAVPFEQLFAEHTLVGNTLLLGDAARTFGPVSAASMNLGLIEAEMTCLAIAKSLQKSTLIEKLESLADSFAINWQSRFNANPYSITTDETDRWIGENRGRILPNLPVSGPEFGQLAQQLNMGMNTPHLAYN